MGGFQSSPFFCFELLDSYFRVLQLGHERQVIDYGCPRIAFLPKKIEHLKTLPTSPGFFPNF